MSYMGLRVGEVHTLNQSDYNVERRSLRVFGKGRKWRNVPVPEDIAPYLDQALTDRLNPWHSKEEAMFISQKAAGSPSAASKGLLRIHSAASRVKCLRPSAGRTPAISCGTPLPPCCCARERICARCRSCWAIPRSRRPLYTHILRTVRRKKLCPDCRSVCRIRQAAVICEPGANSVNTHYELLFKT